MGPPPPAGEGQAPGGGPGQPQGFVRSLQDLLGLLNPANAVAGDAVYSQEALDRIISNLMEVNPQSNAAPPASEDALSKMVRKPVDAEMLGTDDKTECSICIDEMKIGDTAMFLPCKHWFHEDCVVLWLKEHNTCPICRTPIEKNDRPGPTSSGNSNNGSGSGDAQQQQQQQGQGQGQGEQPQPGAPQSGARDGAPPPSVPGGWSNFMLGGDGSGTSSPGPSIWFTTRRFEIPTPGSMSASDGSSSASYRQSARPPSQRHSRLNEALRSVSSMQERNRERERERMTGGGNLGLSTGVNPFPDFDTWRLQRRNSLSPTSRRTPTSATRDGDGGTPRVRERSPSQSSGRWAESDRRQAEADQERSGRTRAQNPLSWLRGRLGGGSSGGGSGRSHEGGSGSGGSGSGDDPRS